MSTVMYAFRAKSKEHLARQLAAIEDINSKRIFKDGSEEVQIFYTSVGIVWRVLENGYAIENQLWKNGKMFPTCNYDDRTDIPNKDVANKTIANEIDRLISEENYQIVSI